MFMKRQFSFLWAAFALLASFPCCTPSYVSSSPSQTSALVKLECHNAPVNQILAYLRSGRGKDITVVPDGSAQLITAAFSPADTPPEKLVKIVQYLTDLEGVLHVEVAENPHPIRQSF